MQTRLGIGWLTLPEVPERPDSARHNAVLFVLPTLLALEALPVAAVAVVAAVVTVNSAPQPR
jgi:hypothetical protein